MKPVIASFIATMLTSTLLMSSAQAGRESDFPTEVRREQRVEEKASSRPSKDCDSKKPLNLASVEYKFTERMIR